MVMVQIAELCSKIELLLGIEKVRLHSGPYSEAGYQLDTLDVEDSWFGYFGNERI